MVNAQQWLNANYPKEERKEVRELNINRKELEGELDLSDFANLERLNCSRNKLTSLNLTSSTKLEEIYCYNNEIKKICLTKLERLRILDAGYNLLTNLDFSALNPENLLQLKLHSNNFAAQDLDCLTHFYKLEILYINTDKQERIEEGIFNRFYGSLEALRNMHNLRRLDIRNTDIDNGLKYLSKSVERLRCEKVAFSNNGHNPKVAKIREKLVIFNYDIRIWREWKNRGFTHEQAKEWLDIGMKFNDNDYAQWFRDFKNKDAKWVLNHSDKQKLRQEYEEFLQEVTKGSKLSTEIIKKIKDFDRNSLTSEQISLVDKLLTNKTLNCLYKWYGLCKDCKQLKTAYNWCKFCNSSGNEEIDMLMQKYQSGATNNQQLLEWIPYEQFTNIEYLAEGGFGKIHVAKWSDKGEVALKTLNDSQSVPIVFLRFLQEIAYHKLVDDDNWIVSCYGISQDPETKNYIMVMEYMKNGDLRQYLQQKTRDLSFKNKFRKLYSIASGLCSIHRQGLVHRDLHSGNILDKDGDTYGYCCITDLGLCRPANETDEGKIYGVLPYVAPEVLTGKPCTLASDIYSFGIMAYELFSSLPPYHNIPHDLDLALKICQGLRPDLDNIKMPQLLRDLIKRCWDADPSKRPTASDLDKTFKEWWDYLYHDKKNTEFYQQFKEIEIFSSANNLTFLPIKFHLQAVYASRLLNFRDSLPEPQNSKEINDWFWNSTNSSLFELKTNDFVTGRNRQVEVEQQSEVNAPTSNSTQFNLVFCSLYQMLKSCLAKRKEAKLNQNKVVIKEKIQQQVTQTEIPPK